MGYAGESVTGIDMKVLRVRLGMTQRQLAEALGISQSQIVNYERGYTRGADPRPVAIPRVVELACQMLEVLRERGEI
jgi:transcriptional regulator with XRE-family HTH domain